MVAVGLRHVRGHGEISHMVIQSTLGLSPQGHGVLATTFLSLLSILCVEEVVPRYRCVLSSIPRDHRSMSTTRKALKLRWNSRIRRDQLTLGRGVTSHQTIRQCTTICFEYSRRVERREEMRQ